MGQTLRVVFVTSGRAGQELVLDQPVVRIGRDPDSEVLFDEGADRVVSRRHAEIRWEGPRPVLHPAAGKTVLRGGALLSGPTPLVPGDLIEFAGAGGPSIRVVFDGPPVLVPQPLAAPPVVAPRAAVAARSFGDRAGPAPVLRIRINTGSLAGHVYDVPAEGLVAGRSSGCNLRFNPDVERTVSSRHCVFRVENGQLVVEDLGSRNGLYLNGFPATRAELSPGDQVALGNDGPVVQVLEPATPAADPADFKTEKLSLDEIKTEMAIPAFVAPEASAAQPPAWDPDPSPRGLEPSQAPSLELDEPTPVAPAPQAAVAPAAPAAATAAPAAHQEPPQQGTQVLLNPISTGTQLLMSPVDASGSGGPVQTQFLMAPLEPPPRRPWKKWAALATVTLVVGVGLGVAADQWERQQKRQRVLAKIERLREAFRSNKPLEALSVEEWELYGAIKREEGGEIDTELARAVQPVDNGRQAPPAPSPEEVARRKAEEEERQRKAEEAKAEAKRLAEARAKFGEEVRSAFAALRRAELERLQIARAAKGGGKPRARFVMLGEKRQDLLQQYDGAVAKLELPAASGTDAIVRTTARHLGECDACLPDSFLAKARTALSARRGDAAAKQKLLEALKRSRDNHYAQTVTAALADQGLPVELFFLAVELSGLDPKAVGTDAGVGVPKGMWMLVPETAQKFGANPGPLATQPVFDDADDRARVEVESRAAAKYLRSVFFGPAAGSALLLAAAYSNGDGALLAKLKQQAGLGAAESDPGKVSFWRLWEANALTDSARSQALSFFALVAMMSQPKAFGFDFAPPLEHVALAEGTD